MTAPLLDRLAEIIKAEAKKYPPGYDLDEGCRHVADALLASEEWQAREAVVEALERCESSRGAFSCSEPHDGRCPKARAARASEWRGVWVCVCGREALDAALARLDAVKEEG